MEKLRYILFLLFSIAYLFVFPQTFSNNSSNAHDTWNSANAWATALSKTITVSGLPTTLSNAGTVLKQVNLRLGNGSNTGLNLSTYYIRLYHPDGITFIDICSAGGNDCGGSSIGDVNIKYRDNSYLKSIGQLPSGTPSAAWPYHIGYYRVVTANSFASFNGLNPNGDWVLKIVEATVTEIAFSGVDLVFGSPFVIEDITGSSVNDACSGAQCIDNSKIYIGTNNGYASPGPATDPNLTQGSCSWNGAKNNSAWFYFQANGTSVNLSISGLSAMLQSIGVYNSGTCASPNYFVPSGGCPNDAVNNNYSGGASHGSSGMSYNHSLNFSGLVTGNLYQVLIDGTGGAISPVYIEVTGNCQSCQNLLPVQLSYFDFKCIDGVTQLNWSTQSELNNEYFTVMASTDGNEWIDVTKINGAGNSNELRNYQYKVPSSLSNYLYYKLKQTDTDGKYTYSKIIYANCAEADVIDFYPNPFEDVLSFKLNHRDEAVVDVYDNLGQIIYTNTITNSQTQIDLNQLASGVYYLKVNQSKSYKIIKK